MGDNFNTHQCYASLHHQQILTYTLHSCLGCSVEHSTSCQQYTFYKVLITNLHNRQQTLTHPSARSVASQLILSKNDLDLLQQCASSSSDSAPLLGSPLISVKQTHKYIKKINKKKTRKPYNKLAQITVIKIFFISLLSQIFTSKRKMCAKSWELSHNCAHSFTGVHDFFTTH